MTKLRKVAVVDLIVLGLMSLALQSTVFAATSVLNTTLIR